MEPFDLSLHKVNLEEKDIGEGDALNAFSDIYSYDSDFQSESSSLPVRSKKLAGDSHGKRSAREAKESLIDLIHASNKEYYTYGSGRAGSHDYRLPEGLRRDINSPTGQDDSAASSPQHTDSPRGTDSPQSNKGDITGNSFRAFTDTGDALALQTSVIGKKTLAPASAEEIAQAIAATQRKLLNQSSDSVGQTQSHKPGSEQEVVTEPSSVTNTANSNTTVTLLQQHSHFDTSPSVTDSQSVETSSNDQLVSTQSLAHNNQVNDGPTEPRVHDGGSRKMKSKHKKTPSASSNGSSPRGSKQEQELIPIPKAGITTSVQKSSSWFISRAACSNPHVAVESKETCQRHVVGDNSGSDKDDNDSETPLQNSVVMAKESSHMKSDNLDSVVLVTEETVIATESLAGEMSHEIAVHTTLNAASAFGEAIVLENIKWSEEPELIRKPVSSAPTVEAATDSLLKAENETALESKVNTREKHPSPNRHKQKHTENVTNDNNPSESQSFQNSPVVRDEYDPLKRQIDILMKARAKLEGQLEVMEVESKMALKQRADLQTQVAALQQQLKAQEVNVTMATNEREALSSDMKTMKETRGRLEQVIVDAQKIIEDKDQDLETVREDLRLAQKASEELQAKLKETKRDVQSKSSTTEDLKNKIAELYVQFETTNQTKILLENELKSVRSELKTLSTAKEWYQDQLKQAQNAKNGLQREVTSVKGELIAKSTVIERLKADNVRLKQHLTDTQQRIIQEKQLLAQHLEAIEADMMEREAAFSHIQRERDALQEMLKSRGHNPDLALQEFSNDVTQESGDLANDLDLRRLQNDVKRKQAHIAVLEHEQAELMKRLALSQESILERDKNLETIEQKYVGVEVELRKFQQEIGFSNEELSKVSQEKGLIEIELRSVKEEKSSFDSVIQNLKGDMSKVESSFRRIKQELTKKTDELNRVKIEKDQANEDLAKQTSSQIKAMVKVSDEIATVHVHSDDSIQESSQKAEETIHANSVDKSFENDLIAVKSQNSALEKEIDQLTKDTDLQLQKLKSEKLQLEKKLLDISQNNDRSTDAGVIFQETVKDLGKSAETILTKSHIEQYQITKEDLVKLYCDVNSESVSKVIDENCRLKLVILQMQRHHVTEATSGQTEVLQAKITQLQHDNSDLESKMADASVTAVSQKESLAARVTELELELSQSKRDIETSEEDRILALTLELEKERGKFAGAIQNYEQLKTHTGVLESIIATKESNSVQMSSQAQQDLLIRDKDIDELQTTISVLQTSLGKEKSVVKEIKKQLMTERGNHVKTRRKYESLFVEHDQMRLDYENKIQEVQEMRDSLLKAKESEANYRTEHDKMLTVVQYYKVEFDRLQREVGEQQARDPVLNDRIKTLEWNVQEKEQEVHATVQQLKLVEDRQIVEVDNMRKTIQTNTNELSKLREELTITKREKASVHARVVDLKAALQSTVNASKAGSPLKIDLSAIEKLLKETNSPSKQSKPLSFLQATLSDLRGEISTLQNQMEEHASAVQSSSIAWKELEQQVKDLRDVCKSTAAEREASQSLLTGAAHAAAMSPIAMVTQAAARSQSKISFIPPLPVELPANIDFSFPQDVTHTNTNGDMNSELAALETVIDTGSGKSSKTGTPERRLNTKAMPLNSIYAP